MYCKQCHLSCTGGATYMKESEDIAMLTSIKHSLHICMVFNFIRLFFFAHPIAIGGPAWMLDSPPLNHCSAHIS